MREDRAVLLRRGKVWHSAPKDYHTGCGIWFKMGGSHWIVDRTFVNGVQPKCHRPNCWNRDD